MGVASFRSGDFEVLFSTGVDNAMPSGDNDDDLLYYSAPQKPDAKKRPIV